MNKLNHFLILLFVATIILSCSNRPIGLIKEKKMEMILEDFYKAEAIFKKDSKNYIDNQKKDALIASILDKHGITQADLDKSLAWYVDNMDVYGVILDSVSAKVERASSSLSIEYENLYKKNKLFGLNVDLPNFYVLDNVIPSFNFNIDSLRMQKIDKNRILFNFRTQGVDTVFHDIEAGVYFRYADTTVFERQSVRSDGFYTLIPPTNLPIDSLKDMSAYIHLEAKGNNIPRVILYDLKNQEALDPQMDSLLNAIKQM